MTLLKTADKVTTVANKAKKEIKLKGTNGDEDTLNETVFCVVRAMMGRAKMEHAITVDMREAVMEAIDSNAAAWDMWECKYAHGP